jgi:hypothetical protein
MGTEGDVEAFIFENDDEDVTEFGVASLVWLTESGRKRLQPKRSGCQTAPE